MQLYFEKITELTVSRFGSPLFKEALVSLATDSGLHPLVPYFTYFVADEVIMMPISVLSCSKIFFTYNGLCISMTMSGYKEFE